MNCAICQQPIRGWHQTSMEWNRAIHAKCKQKEPTPPTPPEAKEETKTVNCCDKIDEIMVKQDRILLLLETLVPPPEPEVIITPEEINEEIEKLKQAKLAEMKKSKGKK